MTRSSILTLFFAFGFMCVLAGCTASSELEEENGSQQQTPAAVTPPPVVKPVQAQPAQTPKQGFTTKEDTIEVESAQRNHRPEHKPVVPVKQSPAVTAFRVQIGAFKEEANAQRATGLLAKRYHKQAAFYFDDASKLFRVTIGNFATEKEAKKFAAAMKKKYPREYKNTWVVRRAE